MTATEHRDALALAYASRGWPVVLLEPGGKNPIYDRRKYAHGVNEATSDADRLTNHLWRWPDAGVGIATGAPGPTVQDVDDLEHPGARSVIAGIAKSTPTVDTPRGHHFYFAGRRG